MTRAIEQRLRKLEVATSGPPKLWIVWSNTSDPAEWDERIAEMLASGRASPSDEFMRIGWVYPELSDGPCPDQWHALLRKLGAHA
jgi:hypothetical protein